MKTYSILVRFRFTYSMPNIQMRSIEARSLGEAIMIALQDEDIISARGA